MFFQNNTGGGESIKSGLDSAISQLGVLEDGIAGISKTLTQAVNPTRILKDAQYIASSTVNMTREVLGQGREIGMMLSETMAQARVETLEFGVTNEQNVALFSAINKELQNTRYLTKEQIVDMQALAKTAGLTGEEMAKFVVNFDTLGVSTDMAIDKISQLQGEARSYGINVGQFMRTVGENIKLVASYNFKGGVDGLAKMVAQAQSLRIDMSKTVAFAEDMLSPEKAIETAAGFQMLGGAVGKLGDPFQLLHMAQTDMAGLQDSLVDMAAASVTFNEETGEFDIPVTEMYRLREAAKLAGMSYQDFSEMAMNSAKKTQKLQFLEGMSNIPEEQKEMIANLSELKDGKLQVKLPGQDDMKDVAQLTADELGELKTLQSNMGRSDKELAARSTTALEEMANKIASLAAIPEKIVIETGQFEKTTESMTTSVNNLVEAMENDVKTRDYGKSMEASVDLNIPTLSKESAEAISKGIFDSTEKIIEKASEGIKDLLKGAFGDLEGVNITSDNVVIVADRSNFDEGNRSREEGTTTTPQSANDLVITNDGQAFQTAVDDYIFAISQNNLNNLSNTISALSTNTISPNNPSSADLNVNGTVRVDIAGTNVNMTESQLNDMVRNNPSLIATIMKQITGSENNYGGVNS